jgi:hypothetical protein
MSRGGADRAVLMLTEAISDLIERAPTKAPGKPLGAKVDAAQAAQVSASAQVTLPLLLPLNRITSAARSALTCGNTT